MKLSDIPSQTSDIFEILSKGKFICSLSNEQSMLYEMLSDEYRFDLLQSYFSYLNFRLEK